MFQEINDYIILKTLGKGSFGEVHLVKSVDNEQYALKKIPVTKEDKASAKNQAEMYVSFKHPNIIKAREFFFYKKEQFLVIVLEYCPDGSLSNFIGKLNPKCREIMKQIAEGVVYLHDKKKTLHRDLKPQNILMMDGIPKIADLGISKAMKTEGLSTKVCTPFYASPQFYNEERYEFPADIWSLGIIFWEMLSGQRINKRLKGLKPPCERNDFPSNEILNEIKEEDLRELVRKMLVKDPESRLKAKDVLDILIGNNVQMVQRPQNNERKEQSYTNVNQRQGERVVINQVKQGNNVNEQEQIAIAKKQNQLYKFSKKQKNYKILLDQNDMRVASQYWAGDVLALVDGAVYKKGSVLRFRVEQVGGSVGFGLGLRKVIEGKSFNFTNSTHLLNEADKIGHGCFLLQSNGQALSHSNKEYNAVQTGLKFGKGDVIEVETNEKELLVREKSGKWKFSLSIQLSEDDWHQACFCVQLRGNS